MFKNHVKVIALFCVCVGAMLVSAQDATPTPVNPAPTAVETTPTPVNVMPKPVDLRVMTFNIWLGGDLVNFGKVVEAIQAAKADVVALQETNGQTRRIADALGWPYASDRTHIISRYPLLDVPGANGDFIYIELAPGQVVALADVHLTSDPYGPDAVAAGSTMEAVMKLEQDTRMPDIEPVLAHMADLVKADMPVFILGDFNTPSHLDWTAATINTRPQMKYAMAWPVTQAVEKAGFVDTFRAIYPDPVANPGITWSYGHPYPYMNPNDLIDRIDLIFAANADKVLNSEIVGEAGTPNVNIGIVDYPSDHRAVVSTVRVTPSVIPPFVAVDQRLLMQGEALVVRYRAPVGESTDKIVLVPTGGNAVDDAIMSLPPYEAILAGSVTFGTATLDAGAYDVVLMTRDNVEVSRSPFWITTPDLHPTIMTDQTTYEPGKPITVTFKNAPAMKNDWVAIYPRQATNLYSDYIAYIYTGAAVDGTLTFDTSVIGQDMLPAGDYVVYLLKDDGYEVLAKAQFSVGVAGPPIVN